MTTLTTAVIGCGVIGRTHAKAILELSDQLTLVAFADPSPERTSDLADFVENGTGTRPATYDTVHELLEAEHPQLVVIATPSGLHVEQAIAALEAGAHVLIEKPLDVDLARARRLTEAARAAAERGQVCSVISQHRFDHASQVVHNAIASGDLGRVTSGVASVAWWRSQAYYDSGDWRGTWAMDGGGAVMNQGVHTVDLLLWFLGRPVSVSAEIALLAHENVEVEDTAVATVTFENGALGVIHATTAAYPGLSVRLQIAGTKGSAIIDNDALEYIHISDGTGNDMGLLGGGNQVENYPEPAADGLRTAQGVDATQFPIGHVRQYRDVLAAIAEGRDPLLTVDTATLALATVRAIYLSALLNKKVRIDDVIAGDYDDTTLSLPTAEVTA